MKRPAMSGREIGFVLPVAVATVGLAWLLPGPPWAYLDQPPYLGALGYLALVALVLAQRLRGRRGSRFERRCLALFLAAMPVVYLAGWGVSTRDPVWLWIELAGVALFWPLAVLGILRSPWYLAGGIAAHGAWDLWHHGLTAYVPEWYTLGCLVVDLAVAVYVSGEVEHFEKRQRTLR